MVWRHLIRVLFFFSWLRTVVAVAFFSVNEKASSKFCWNILRIALQIIQLYHIYVSAIFTRPNKVKHIVEYFQISKHMFWQKLIVLRLEIKKKSRITTRESDKWKKFIKKCTYIQRDRQKMPSKRTQNKYASLKLQSLNRYLCVYKRVLSHETQSYCEYKLCAHK